MSDASIYVHGSGPDEQQRLSLLNELLNGACLRELELRPGERVLDLGSGLGQFSRAMARAGGKVVAVERDPQQLQRARALAVAAGEAELVDFRAGDAAKPPLQDSELGTFDVAHTRFLLEHLRKPATVVQAMLRAVRPGGRIVLLDDDHELLRLWPPAPAVEAWWRAYFGFYETIGNDPAIGRKLVALLHSAGARPVRSAQVNFGACAGQPTFQPLVDNFVGVMETAGVLAAGLVTAKELAAARAELAAWRRLPDAALWYVVAFAAGVRP